MTPSKTIHTRVPLTAEELAELDRRKSNAAANRAIMSLKQDLKGVKYCFKLLRTQWEADRKEATILNPNENLAGIRHAVQLLRNERDRIQDLIESLEASKRYRDQAEAP